MMTSLHAVFCLITGVTAYVMTQSAKCQYIGLHYGDNQLSYQALTSLYIQCHSDNNSHIIFSTDINFMEIPTKVTH